MPVDPRTVGTRSCLGYPFENVTKGAGEYDWRGSAGGDLDPPVPEVGEVWELLGVQTGFFDDFSSDVWKEFTGIPLPRPYSASGFVTPFEYIAVKKLGGRNEMRQF
ncbi:MAG: hypothetical protein ABI939_07015, partial [Anaerolineaceae bacterium]